MKITADSGSENVPIQSTGSNEALEQGLVSPTRYVQTNYWRGSVVVKITRAEYPDRAAVSAMKHIQANDYAANVAEVFNSVTGFLYSVIRTGLVKGEPCIITIFKDDTKLQQEK